MKSLNVLVLAGLMVSGTFLFSCSDNGKGNGGGDEEGYPSYVANGSEYNQWTYFDFATGTGRTEAVKSQSGAVEGIYSGDFSYSVGGSKGSQSSVQMIISRISDDSVSVSMSGILMSMGAKADTIELAANAGVKKEGNSWVLSGVPGSVMNGKTEYHDIVFNGTIGTEKGGAVDLTLAFIPGAMPINGTYKGEVPDNKSWVSGIDETSFDWDIAFHKYDIRTNGGSVVKTDRSALSAVTTIPTSGFEEDVEAQVIVDMSKMMQGFVGYQSCTVNKVLGSWVTATPTGSMPPYTYTLNNNVYIVKTKSGQYAKIKFYDMTNEKGKAVYAAFNYEFPMK